MGNPSTVVDSSIISDLEPENLFILFYYFDIDNDIISDIIEVSRKTSASRLKSRPLRKYEL